MINKFVVSVVLTYAFLMMPPTFAMDSQLTSQTKSNVALIQQLEKVVEYINQREAQGLPVKMVLGAVNTEYNRINGDEWIFFDTGLETQHDPLGKPYIQASFNNIDELSLIAKMVGPRLDQIVMDDSTFKFTEWKTEHIQLFANMLKENGDFIFPISSTPSTLHAEDLNVSINTDADLLSVLKEINPFPPDSIPVAYTTLTGWWDARRAAFYEWMEKDPANGALLDEFLINEHSKVDNLCKNEIFYAQIRNVLSKSFENVSIKEDAPLIIKSSFGNTKDTLVWATKPKR